MAEEADLLKKWLIWVTDIQTALLYVHHDRELWESLNDAITQEASDTPTIWRSHYLRLYVATQAMAIRRIIRSAPGKDSITLGRLLEDIKKHPGVLDRQRYVERWVAKMPGDHGREMAGRTFDANWDDGSGGVDLTRLQKDKADLNSMAQKVIEYADHFIAHIVDGEQDIKLTLGELHKAIDHTGDSFRHWALLVTQVDHWLTPTVVDAWQTTFDRPLFPPDGRWL
jgi:hypothetical protein